MSSPPPLCLSFGVRPLSSPSLGPSGLSPLTDLPPVPGTGTAAHPRISVPRALGSFHLSPRQGHFTHFKFTDSLRQPASERGKISIWLLSHYNIQPILSSLGSSSHSIHFLMNILTGVRDKAGNMVSPSLLFLSIPGPGTAAQDTQPQGRPTAVPVTGPLPGAQCPWGVLTVGLRYWLVS